MTNLTPWRRHVMNPSSVRPVTRQRGDWDRLFVHFLDDAQSGPLGTNGAAHGVRLDLTETEDEVLVKAEVPGIDPEDLEIRLHGDVLTVSGEKSEETEHTEGSRHVSERVFGSFQRTLQLPVAVDPEKVIAESKHGVVTITLKKSEAAKSRRIDVQTS